MATVHLFQKSSQITRQKERNSKKSASSEPKIYTITEDQLLIQTGLEYIDKDEWDEAIHYFSHCLVILNKSKNLPKLALVFGYLGYIQLLKGEFEIAEKMINQSLKLYTTLKGHEGVALSLLRLGIIYNAKNRWERAQECLSHGLKYAISNKKPYLLAECLFNLSNYYCMCNSFNERIKSWEYMEKICTQALTIIQELDYSSYPANLPILNYQKLKLNTLITLGLIYFSKKDLTHAEYYLKTSNQHELCIDKSISKKRILSTLAKIKWVYGNITQAKKYWQELLKVCSQPNDLTYIMLGYQGLGRLFREIGQLERAESYYQNGLDKALDETLERDTSESHNLLKAELLYDLIKTSILLDRLSKARIYMKRLTLLRTSTNKPSIDTIYYLAIGLIKLKEQDFITSQQHFLYAKNLATTLNDYYWVIDILELLIQVHIQIYHTGQFKKHTVQIEPLLCELEHIYQQERLGRRIIESIVIRGFIENIHFNFPEASQYFERALYCANELGIRESIEKVQKLKNNFNSKTKNLQLHKLSPEAQNHIQTQEIQILQMEIQKLWSSDPNFHQIR
ncbi:MAG: tetratricopeptide repeat protein [Promethearchaeota archaeon]